MRVKRPTEVLRKRAFELGAQDALVIKVSSVATGAWVRYKCQFGCSGFGESLTCPPYSPVPEETQKILDSYRYAILIHTKGRAKKDISKIVLQLEKEAFFAGYYKAFAMGAGPCRLCADCSLKTSCRHPEDARPSMEACGIDVFRTARNNGFEIKTLDSTSCRANYYGLVLLE